VYLILKNQDQDYIEKQKMDEIKDHIIKNISFLLGLKGLNKLKLLQDLEVMEQNQIKERVFHQKRVTWMMMKKKYHIKVMHFQKTKESFLMLLIKQ